MVSSNVLVSLGCVAILSSFTCCPVDSRKPGMVKPCSKEYIREMVLKICGRHKRSPSDTDTVDRHLANIRPESHLPGEHSLKELGETVTERKSTTTQGKEARQEARVPSSLDTLIEDITIAEEWLDVVDITELGRYVRATKTLTHCCKHKCTLADFIGLC